MTNRCNICGFAYSTRLEYAEHNCNRKQICGSCKSEIGWFNNFSLCTYCGAEGEKFVKEVVEIEEDEMRKREKVK